jgi:hypothetical protein
MEPPATSPPHADLLAMASRHKTLEEVVRWSLALTPRRIISSVVVQDEYTHDVVLPYSEGVYLVYDTT